MWIWAWSFGKDEDEREANYEPSTSEEQELKRLFEGSVGQDFLKYSYQPQYRLARSLFEWAMHGIHSTFAMSEASNFLDEWATIRPSSMPRIRGIYYQGRDDPWDSEYLPEEEDSKDSESQDGEEIEEAEGTPSDAIDPPNLR